MDKILTIVVPVYNTQDYLKRCLESVTKSNYVQELEILVINDGSKDDSLEIARQFESRFRDNLRVIDKPNGGWGTVVKRGIQEATGRYFRILDSDDWFDTREFDIFIEYLHTVQSDIVITNYTTVINEDCKYENLFRSDLNGSIMTIDTYGRVLEHENYSELARLTYSKTILTPLLDLLPDKYYADVIYDILPLYTSKNISFCDANVYQYWRGNEDQSTSTSGYIAHKWDYANMVRILLQILDQNEDSDLCNLHKSQVGFLMKHVKFVYYMALSPMFNPTPDDTQKLIEFDEYISKYPKYYSMSNKKTIRKVIPFIWLWRKTRLNAFKLKPSWI